MLKTNMGFLCLVCRDLVALRVFREHEEREELMVILVVLVLVVRLVQLELRYHPLYSVHVCIYIFVL